MHSTTDEQTCPFCGRDIIVDNQLVRCVGCEYVSLYGHSCPSCGGSIGISNTQSTCRDCGYARQFPAD